jgi:uncharacterized repeat protein (TIGR01451 family)
MQPAKMYVWLFYIAICCPFLFTPLQTFSKNIAKSAGAQTFSMDLPNAGPYDPAAMVVVRYRYSCSSLTTGCGNLTITTVVPTTLAYIYTATPPGTNASYDSGTRTLTITRNPYLGGESGDVLVTYKIDPSAAGQTIVVPGVSVITDPTNPSNGTINDDVTINVSSTPPVVQYEVEKTKSIPTGTPAVGTNVRYSIQLFASQINGNVDTTPITIVDTYPAGATVIDAAGGTVDTGAHTITWTFPSTYLLDSWARANRPLTGRFPLAFRANGYDQDYLNITLNYPSGTFNTSSNVTNSVCFTGTSNGGGALNACDDAAHGFASPVTDLNPNKVTAWAGSAIPGGEAKFDFDFNIQGSNTPILEPIMEDAIPAGYGLKQIRRGEFNYTTSGTKARLEYSTNNKASWNVIEDNITPNSGGQPQYKDYVVGTDFPTGVTHIRWVFFDDGNSASPNQLPINFSMASAGYTEANFVLLDIPTSTSAGTTIQNCITVSGTNATAENACATHTVQAPKPNLLTYKYQYPTSTPAKPGDEIEWEITFQNDGASGPATNPIAMDFLPPELEFVRWSNYTSTPATLPSPNLEVLNNYNSTGRTLLRWTWSNTPPAGSYDLNGAPGVANAGTLARANHIVSLRFVTRIKPGTAIGSYINRTYATATDPVVECTYGRYFTDTNDFDGDGSTTDQICYTDNTPSFSVIAAVVMGAEKWIKGHASLPNVDDPASTPAIPDAFCPVLDGSYTRFPCIARTVPGGTFDYKIKLINYGNLPLKNYVAYDVFPFVGDTGVSEILTAQARDTQWSPFMTSAPTAADAYTTSVLALPGAEIAYTFSNNPCRPEMSNSTNESGWQTGCTNDWTTSVSDWTTVKGFRLTVPFTNAPYWEPGKEIVLNVPMQVPTNAPFETVAWNSIAHRSTNAGVDPSVTTTRLDTAEPRKVGIAIPTGSVIPGYRLGNLVWMDTNKDGMADSGEMGIEGVLVELYSVSGGTETFVSSTNTDANGKYLFTALNAGDYVVKIPSNQSPALNPSALNGKTSSTAGEEADPDSDGDNNDNGTIVNATDVKSAIVTLGEGTGLTEPTTELDRKGSTTDDDNDAFADNRSNVSVDFGFIVATTCSINTPVVTVTCSDNGTGNTSADDTFTFTISATGTGTGTSYKVDKTNPTPSATVFASVNYGTTSASSSSFPISGGNLTLTLTDNTTSSCTLTNVNVPAPAPCSTPTPVGQPDLELTKTANKTQVVSGNSLTYTLTLKNVGTAAATSVKVRDRLPAGLTYVSSTSSQGTYTIETGIWDVGTVAAGAVITLIINVTVD